MKIVALIKQVPAVDSIRFDVEQKRIVREGVPLNINSFDRRALGAALALREHYGGEVIALTMGPPQAESALRECLAMGADRAVHLSDRAFAGADTLATARTLAMAVQRLGAQVVTAGKFSLDAETGQVGPEVAELLGWPQITSARSLEPIDEAALRIERETDEGIEVIEIGIPCVITNGEWMVRPDRPTPEAVSAANGKPVEVITAADLSGDASAFGLAGSPTWVSEIYAAESDREQRVAEGDDPQAAAAEIVRYLTEKGLFTENGAGRERQRRQRQSRQDLRAEDAVWVVAEFNQDGNPREVTLELLGRGGELADRRGVELVAIALGYLSPEAAKTLAAYGADRILVIDHSGLVAYLAETHAAALTEAIQAKRPYAVLTGSTANGRDFLPRVAARLGLGLTGDAIGLDIDEEGRLVQLKPAFGGNIVAPILTRTSPARATVRAGTLDPLDPDYSREAPVDEFRPADVPAVNKRVLYTMAEGGDEGAELGTADVVVTVGAGIGGPEFLPLARALAEALDAPIAATLKVAALGWVPKTQHVGMTGKHIAPRFYIGLGVRGAFYHTVGVRKSGTMVVINNDPEADFTKGADLFVKGDVLQILPILTEELQKAKARAVPA